MNFEKFGMVMSDTSRSRAYLQLLIACNFFPSRVLILSPEGSNNNLLGNFSKSTNNESYKKFENFSFNPEFSVFQSLKSYKINFESINAKSVNEKNVIIKLKDFKEKFLVYSGFGGIILKKEVLSIDKKFIHVHGGFLPNYKGSTCNYYSIIKSNFIGAASIIMNEKIDGGPVLITKKFKTPKNKLLIDHYYDPLIRAIVLLETIKNLLKNKIIRNSINNKEGDMYYVIHPVLKHISILK
jgi:methionyl-tRNA formyltransferase